MEPPTWDKSFTLLHADVLPPNGEKPGTSSESRSSTGASRRRTTFLLQSGLDHVVLILEDRLCLRFCLTSTGVRLVGRFIMQHQEQPCSTSGGGNSGGTSSSRSEQFSTTGGTAHGGSHAAASQSSGSSFLYALSANSRRKSVSGEGGAPSSRAGGGHLGISSSGTTTTSSQPLCATAPAERFVAATCSDEWLFVLLESSNQILVWHLLGILLCAIDLRDRVDARLASISVSADKELLVLNTSTSSGSSRTHSSKINPHRVVLEQEDAYFEQGGCSSKAAASSRGDHSRSPGVVGGQQHETPPAAKELSSSSSVTRPTASTSTTSVFLLSLGTLFRVDRSQLAWEVVRERYRGFASTPPRDLQLRDFLEASVYPHALLCIRQKGGGGKNIAAARGSGMMGVLGGMVGGGFFASSAGGGVGNVVGSNAPGDPNSSCSSFSRSGACRGGTIFYDFLPMIRIHLPHDGAQIIIVQHPPVVFAHFFSMGFSPL